MYWDDEQSRWCIASSEGTTARCVVRDIRPPESAAGRRGMPCAKMRQPRSPAQHGDRVTRGFGVFNSSRGRLLRPAIVHPVGYAVKLERSAKWITMTKTED